MLWHRVKRFLNFIRGWNHSIIKHLLAVSLLKVRFLYRFCFTGLLLLVNVWFVVAVMSFLLIVVLDKHSVVNRVFFAVLSLTIFEVDHVVVVSTGLQFVCAALGSMHHVRRLLVVASVHHWLGTDHLLLDQ